jgi:nucleotide-binding universal stress UspA family protein
VIVVVRLTRDSDQQLLLFADDGEPPADVAWAWITSHRWPGWSLEAVTVHWASITDGEDLRVSRFVQRTPPAESRFTSDAHVEVSGDPRVVLLDRSDPSLMVVGCHHRGHLAGMWAGSATEWLLVHPPAPVLVARHGYRTRTVAICVDGSPHALRAIEAFGSCPWAAGVELSLVSVEDGHTDVEQALRVAQAALPKGLRAARAESLSGPPKRVLADFARDREVDLVVLGTRGLTGLARLRAGSTVSALLKDTTANLLIAHAGEPATAEA